ncbi:MAG: hypothetical protein A2Z57_04820 [Planctomycetes bacterium RIFCSPHIGHO2_12_39_6]|nr:MAG: hypothetical protein A2Z57_04820 [Planctomycetes bacterium RIFCSPHIGHO2_12_39_6]
MTKEEFIAQVSTSPRYIAICRKLLRGNSLYKDLFQDLLVELLESKEDRFTEILCPDCFIYRMLSNMVNSKTSRFHYKYRDRLDKKELLRITDSEHYDHSLDIDAKRANRVIESLPWHDKQLFREWTDGKYKTKIAREKNIPIYFVRSKVEAIKRKVQAEIIIKNMEQPMKILLVVQKETTALQYHRQYIPHERLNKTHNNEFKIEFTHGSGEDANIDGMTDEQILEYQAIYFLRQISFNKERTDRTIERLKRLGRKIILDIDDYWMLPDDHHWYERYNKENVAHRIIDTLKRVDHVITTTPTFAHRIRSYNTNVTVLPNCISPDAKQFTIREIQSSRLRFGWIGGIFHKPDIAIMKSTFPKISKNIYNDIQVCVGGFSCNYEYKEIEKTFTSNYSFKNSDATYYNYLRQCTPNMEHISYNKQYRRLWGRSIETYGDLYNEIDVALVPLKENGFNKCKSELKIVEAGWMKKAVICSDMSPYREWIRHGINGFLVPHSRNNIDWCVYIRKLTLNPSMARDMGLALHETITKNFDLDTHNRTRADLYKSLLL